MKLSIDPEKVIDIIENKENIKLLEYQKVIIRKMISEMNSGKIPICHGLQKAIRGELDETLPSSGKSGRET